jgi:hypothetical protein
MTRRWYVGAATAAVIGLGLAAGLARAQAPGPDCSPEPWAVIEYGSVAQPGAGAKHKGQDQNPQEPGFTKKGPVRDWAHDCMHRIGVGCWSHHNMYTCSSFHSEFVFVFGSCRQFFGEPCLPGPPEPPMPPGYGPPPSYLPQPGYAGYPPPNSQGYNNLLNSPGYGRGGCPSCQ